MRVLLSTIGSRGEVQPTVALARALRAQSHDVRVCAPPDFRAWVESFDVTMVPLGPEVIPAAASIARTRPTPEELSRMAIESVGTQFATIASAAQGCEVILGCGALQVAARSIAESMGIPYVFASFCPITLPSRHHAPPPLPLRGEAPAPEPSDYAALWARDAQRWNDTFGAALNTHRTLRGMPPVTDVRSHIFTDRPLLAADATLGPWPDPAEGNVMQTGAWILEDPRPLSAELEAFLAAGDAPVYFGFGSMRVAAEAGRVVIETARALGRRAIVAQGWAGLSLPDAGTDCISIGEVNQQALFPRVAAVVHHGGAGTTTAAARAGVPQVVVPQMYDQHYWAGRVEQLGIGAALAPGVPAVASLTSALERCLAPGVAARATVVARSVRTDGAQIAARYITAARD